MIRFRVSRWVLAAGIVIAAITVPAAIRAEDKTETGQFQRVLADFQRNGGDYVRQGTAWFLSRDYVAHLVFIAGDARGGPGGSGLYRPGLSRYDWEWLRQRLDKDGDGAISFKEFGGPREWFETLDKNRDGMLTKEDFEWSGDSALAKASAQVKPLFERIDRDGNGRVSSEEWKQWFDVLAGEKGFLTQDDLLPVFMGSRRGGGGSRGGSAAQMNRLQIITAYLAGDVGPMTEGPDLNQMAPDFELAIADGKGKQSLSQHIGKKPLVLVLGSFTCNRFRAQYGDVENVYRRYHDQADFLGVYVREAHPTDGWSLAGNERIGISIAQPKKSEERYQAAHTCRNSLKMSIPLLVDEMDDRAGNTYCGMPDRLYVIDTQGRVAYKGGRGPFGYQPSEMEQALVLLLMDEAAGKPPAVKNR